MRDYYGDGHDGDGGVEAEYHQPPKPATGGIGDAITLTGTNIGVRLRVTPTRVVDPADASRPARDGMRWVGVPSSSAARASRSTTTRSTTRSCATGRAARRGRCSA